MYLSSGWLIDWLIDSFNRSLIHWFIGSLIHWFIQSLIDSLIHWCIQSFVDLFNHSWFIGSLVCWFVGSLVHWFIGSLDHWFIGSLIHWFIDSVHSFIDLFRSEDSVWEDTGWRVSDCGCCNDDILQSDQAGCNTQFWLNFAWLDWLQ